MDDDASTAAAIRAYFATVADLDSTEAELRALLDPDATFRELPNAIAPNGHVRDVEETIAGFLAGKSRLSTQEIDIDELLVSGDRAAVRSTWRGTIAGTAIVAHMAGFVTVRDGRILAHDTYDCYEPFTL
ncbi:nuclear transport factor 2 family protein [Microbacterium koreense]|uniref:Nuclear transport factor 2 family protein n=1 Tax=Microbacterium koreense TaxID=323761 RepID=A0ABW2ZQC7_9MICO